MSNKYFIRKLTSLGYPDVDKFDVSDEKQYRFVITWLENRFICQYEPEQRKQFNVITSDDWIVHYDKYLSDLKVPFKSDDLNSCLDWLLGLAVQNYYIDNNQKMKFSELTGEQFQKSLQANTVSSLDNLDMNTSDFKAGVYQLATLLGIAHHPDHVRVLKACSRVIVEKLSQTSITKAKAEEGKIKLNFVNIDETAHGMNEKNDNDLKRVTRILRLIHMHNLRKLQMDINSVTIAVQEVVADPKTNEKLGKVGY